MPIAGPVFTEWYWTPLLFVIFAGPPILAVAALLYRLGRRTGWRRRTRAAAALVLAPTVVLGGAAIVSTLRFRHAEAVEARSIAFATFSPDGLHQTRAEVYAGLRPAVVFEYRLGPRVLFASQRAARGDDVTPPLCSVHDGTRHAAYEGPCRAVRTPAGRTATLADTPDPSLLEVREGTLIVAGSSQATDGDLLAYADALRPVAVADLRWER